MRRRRHHSAGNFTFFMLLFIFIFAASLFLFNFRLSPIVRQMAKTRVNYIASKVINDSVNEQMKNIKYDELIYFEKDSDGKITALKTNMPEANRLKTEVLATILKRVSGIPESELSIPSGNLMPSEIFSGRGPKIPVKIIPVGSSNAEFESVFSSAGINQTKHQIIMNITVYISVILPGGSIMTEVNSRLSIAETVIIGNVPDNYTYFENIGSGKEAAEKYFIYGEK